MANFGQSAKDAGEWQSNKEMNIKENSSETDVLSGNEATGEDSWRPTDDNSEQTDATKNSTGAAGQSPAASQKQTGDPGRTPGKVEGEDYDE